MSVELCLEIGRSGDFSSCYNCSCNIGVGHALLMIEAYDEEDADNRYYCLACILRMFNSRSDTIYSLDDKAMLRRMHDKTCGTSRFIQTARNPEISY